nr:Vesicle transport protein [Ipomoea batatas]
MCIHYWLILCPQRSKKSTVTHVIKGEASIYSSFHWQHGGDSLCFNGDAQLYSLCALLRGAGSCSSILCYLLLPGRIDWNEIPLFHPRIFNTKMFRKVTDVCSLHAPITETIPELIHTILPRWSITSKICFFMRLYISVNCIFRAIELHAEPGLIRAGWSTCAYLYQPTGQSPHKKLFVNFEF